jgi:hypothetical protein
MGLSHRHSDPRESQPWTAAPARYPPCPRCWIFVAFPDLRQGGWTCRAGHHYATLDELSHRPDRRRDASAASERLDGRNPVH